MEQRIHAEMRKGNIKETFGMAVAATAIFLIVFLGALSGVRKVTGTPVFAPNTVINGIDLSGLSFDEGKTLILAYDNARLDKIEIKILYNGATASLRAGDLGVSTNAQQALSIAYTRNKLGALLSDFDRSHEPFYMTTELIVDNACLDRSIMLFLKANDIPAQDAQAVFDVQSRSFVYTPAKNGISADPDTVCRIVKKKLMERDYDPLVLGNEFIRRTYAQITEPMLRKNTVLIGQCSTLASNNENRNVNIQLMCDAVDGLVILPGETLSLNTLVGQRTEEKGFRAAPSIIDGQLVDDIGGGICQLAGTLYNAALYADMEIVERVHHTWPSEYLPVGLDATLNWDNKDLKIRNRSQYPIYISAEFKNLVVKIELYGQPPPDGMEIYVETAIVKEIEAPQSEVIYTNKLPAGVMKTKIRSRKGYEVMAYRHYLKDGEVIKSELISHDHFRAVQGTVYMGTDEVIK
jgi:vancomycin resistance protein YoaR